MNNILEVLRMIKEICGNSIDCTGCPLEIEDGDCLFGCNIPVDWDIKGLKNIEE